MKSNQKIIALALLLSLFALPELSLAGKVRRIPLPVKAPRIIADLNLPALQPASTNSPAAISPVSCQVELPAKAEYSAKFLAARRKAFVAKKEIFETKIYLQNTGNMPWFSSASGCKMPGTALGTDKARDRASSFYLDQSLLKSNWLGKNRIQMTSRRVDPQGVAEFTYWSQAPDADGYYREYFAPVVEGVTWIDSGLFFTDTKVGEADLDPAKKDLLAYVHESVDLTKIDINGEKMIDVDLSEQKMQLKIGDYSIREFRISTGKAKTPTPVGETKIIEKREVRVAAKAPHYIMPKWMMYRKGGYGIHALPSLGNDRGIYWREALNHIGIPVSHGCIRLLPKDAEFAYNFAEVGTKVVVHR